LLALESAWYREHHDTGPSFISSSSHNLLYHFVHSKRGGLVYKVLRYTRPRHTCRPNGTWRNGDAGMMSGWGNELSGTSQPIGFEYLSAHGDWVCLGPVEGKRTLTRCKDGQCTGIHIWIINLRQTMEI